MDNKAKFRVFADAAPDLPIFMQPWYLDAVCSDGHWEVALLEKAGKVVAVFPYFIKKKWLWRHIAMPRLCKMMGPYLLPEYRTPDETTRCYEALLEQLPKNLAAFQQDTNYTVTNWLPFYWRNFRQTTRYSYTLSLTMPEIDLLNNVGKNYRKKIRSAAEKVLLRSEQTPMELLRLINLSYARQGLGAPLDPAFFQRFYDALQQQNSCKLFFAIDRETSQIHSAALLVWDRHSAYYLASGDDPVLRNSGAAVWLNWEAILYAKNELKLPVFDFEGSMIKSIEIGRRDFGAVQAPYFRIQKEWSLIWKWGRFLLA